MPASTGNQNLNVFNSPSQDSAGPAQSMGGQGLEDVAGNEISTTSPPKNNISKKKAVVAVFGVLLVVGAVVAGVSLVQKQQDLREQASSASECNQHPDCVVFDDPGNVGVKEVNRQIVSAVITNQPDNEAEFGQGNHDDGCYKVEIENNKIEWEKYAPGPDCKDVSNIQVWMGNPPPTETPTPTDVPPTATPTTPPGATATPTSEVTNTPTDTPTATATIPPGIEAQCLNSKAYDTDWNLLSQSDLAVLKAGDVVRFAVAGTTTSGFFDKARFTINGIQRAEATSKKPGTQEFFDEYVIPEGTTSFTINAQVHHSELGWF